MTANNLNESPSANISVIVPCFNAGATLGMAINSILNQVDVKVEIVVVDDGSTDNSLAVARAFEPWIRVIAGPNRGASAARNRGIAETAAEWVVFLDSDDLLVHSTLRARLNAVKSAEVDVILCDWQELIDDGSAMDDSAPVKSINVAILAENSELACATHFWLPPAAIMYRRALVQKIGGFRTDLPIIQDARFLFDAACHGACFAYSEHVGAIYRVHPQSLSRQDSVQFWRDVLLNGTQIEALWRARGSLTEHEQEALAAIYNNAARGFFAAASPEYFDAVERQHALARPLPCHSRIAAPLARTIGLSSARRMLALIGR